MRPTQAPMNAPMKKIMRRISTGCLALAALLMLSMGFAQHAHAQAGTSAVVFLKIEPDSRAAGMGNAGIALADNASAMFWNPAGLAFQTGTELGITHSNWLPEFNAGLFYEYLVAKHHLPGWGTFGGHLTYLFLGEHEARDTSNISKVGGSRNTTICNLFSVFLRVPSALKRSPKSALSRFPGGTLLMESSISDCAFTSINNMQKPPTEFMVFS